MNSNCGVYCIRCKVNNKAYIGSSVDIKSRWTQHKWKLRAGKHDNKQLQEDYNKYGADNFLYSILINCEPQMLTKYENMYMLLFNTKDRSTGYNILRAARPLYKCKIKIPPRMKQRIQCIETGEIMTKYEACNKGDDYKNLKEHLQGRSENYKGYHWRYVY